MMFALGFAVGLCAAGLAVAIIIGMFVYLIMQEPIRW